MALDMSELEAGVKWWRSSTKWPADLHNADYSKWVDENPHGNFTREWWQPFLKRLGAWIATRPESYDDLTARFERSVSTLHDAWNTACEPFLLDDISQVRWAQVGAFPEEVAKIKPTKSNSPVFPSKFCHFLMPRVFPVADNEGTGDNWRTYMGYFECVQHEWEGTGESRRRELVRHLRTLIEQNGDQAFDGFPWITKVVEMCLIGRRHPS